VSDFVNDVLYFTFISVVRLLTQHFSQRCWNRIQFYWSSISILVSIVIPYSKVIGQFRIVGYHDIMIQWYMTWVPYLISISASEKSRISPSLLLQLDCNWIIFIFHRWQPKQCGNMRSLWSNIYCKSIRESIFGQFFSWFYIVGEVSVFFDKSFRSRFIVDLRRNTNATDVRVYGKYTDTPNCSPALLARLLMH